MDPVTVAAAISATRLVLKGAKDISSIASSMDALLHAKEAHEKNRSEKPADTIAEKNQNILQQRTHDGGEEDDLSTIVNEIDAQKRMEVELKHLENEINKRWPVAQGEKKTWTVILETREQRKKEKAERIEKQRLAAKTKKERDRVFWHKVLIEGSKAVVILVCVGLMTWFLWWASTAPKIR
tara:strand:- start:2131 stop:2676 length:546 start_codon:yes stop_codon:yes gene_type:complete